MTLKALSIFGVLAVLATQAVAQDVTSLRDDQLIGAVAQATKAREADRLLSLMTEVRARGLLMFRAAGQACEAMIPETALLTSLITRGTVQWAYITQARKTAMERGDCGCPFSLLAFDDFTRTMTGSVGADLTRDDLAILQEFRARNEKSVDETWQDFRHNNCAD